MDDEHDWRDRVDQAEERLREVDAMISAFIQTNPYGVVREFTGVMPNLTLIAKMTERRAIPRKVSLLLAEIFGHLRSSLDHLACALAAANGTIPAGTQFPIFKDQTVYEALDKVGNPKRGSGKWQMRGVAPAVQAIIDA